MRYCIATGRSVGELQRDVNEHISDGWRPQGGVGAWSGGMMVMQAMIYEERKEPAEKLDAKTLALPASGNPIL